MAKSIYIHIPFCSSICNYCDFCKVYYDKDLVSKYLDSLEKEIDMRYKNEEIETIYIGGGTPSVLNIDELENLFNIIKKINIKHLQEFTFEFNCEDITLEKMLFLKKNGVTRLSVGVESFNEKFLKSINRKLDLEKLKIAFSFFDNINIDLMYSFSNQSLKDVSFDIDKVLSLKPKHISIYSLIIEKNTLFYINGFKEVSDDIQRKMYDLIVERLEKNGYIHYEISNFAKAGFFSKHNLVYWNNEEYYGFGLGASGFINFERYENTKSFKKYFDLDFISFKEKINNERYLEDEFMLGLRKVRGINLSNFRKKFNFNVMEIPLVSDLVSKKLLLNDGKNIYINEKFLYVSNEIMEKFINSNLLVR